MSVNHHWTRLKKSIHLQFSRNDMTKTIQHLYNFLYEKKPNFYFRYLLLVFALKIKKHGVDANHKIKSRKIEAKCHR